jgi:hypothetical protein
MDGSKQAAEDVIEDKGEQQESAPRQEADAEDQIGDVQGFSTALESYDAPRQAAAGRGALNGYRSRKPAIARAAAGAIPTV